MPEANDRKDGTSREHAFLQLTNVTKRYGNRAVVDGASLSVAEGECVALFGPSGCGKTTTLRIIAGLEAPDEGEVWISGRCAAAKGQNIVPARARDIGFVFQDLALWPHLSVAGNLDFVLSSIGMPKAARAARIEETLSMVHAGSFLHSYPARLSGGEQQRVALARAIVARPRLLLLDEPMSNLDTDLKTALLTEFDSLHRSLGITTIYVTHDRSEAAALASRIAVMRQGRIAGVEAIVDNHRS